MIFVNTKDCFSCCFLHGAGRMSLCSVQGENTSFLIGAGVTSRPLLFLLVTLVAGQWFLTKRQRILKEV